jgi:uncharacterized GH25 family protein
MKFRTLAIALAAAVPFAAQAHRPWLLPSDTVMATDAVITVDAAVSTDLFAFDHNPLRVETLAITAPDGKPMATPPAQTGRLRSVFDLALAQEGTYRIAVVNTGLFANWEENGEPKRWRGTPATFATEVPKDAQKLQVTQNAMRVETFVTAGAPNTAALAPAGAGLELAPATHPNDLYAGETATFGLLIDGKPAAGVQVVVIADGTRFRNAQEEMKFTTDEQGRFGVTFQKAGWYWLNASLQDARNLTAPATQRRASYAATFEVQPQ